MAVLRPEVETAIKARHVRAKKGNCDSITKMSGANEHESAKDEREKIFRRLKVVVRGASYMRFASGTEVFAVAVEVGEVKKLLPPGIFAVAV